MFIIRGRGSVILNKTPLQARAAGGIGCLAEAEPDIVIEDDSDPVVEVEPDIIVEDETDLDIDAVSNFGEEVGDEVGYRNEIVALTDLGSVTLNQLPDFRPLFRVYPDLSLLRLKKVTSLVWLTRIQVRYLPSCLRYRLYVGSSGVSSCSIYFLGDFWRVISRLLQILDLRNIHLKNHLH